MSPEQILRERYALRRQRISDNLLALERLLARSQSSGVPDPMDLPGIAWLLSAVYGEIEEVLKGIATHFSEPLPSATTWHRDLLALMAKDSPQRSAVLSAELARDLDDHRAFRHFSRNATFPVLDWQPMAPLIAGLAALLQRFSNEVEAFLHRSFP